MPSQYSLPLFVILLPHQTPRGRARLTSTWDGRLLLLRLCIITQPWILPDASGQMLEAFWIAHVST